MKKVLLHSPFFLITVIVLLFNIKDASAQKRSEALRFGVGVDVGVPTSDNVSELVLGPSLRLQWDFPKRTSLTLTTAYEVFVEKDKQEISGETFIANQLPVKLGGKFFFGKSYTFYVHPEAGASFSMEKDYGNALVYSGGLGYVTKKGIDLGLRYEGYEFGDSNKMSPTERFGMIALRVAYGIRLR